MQQKTGEDDVPLPPFPVLTRWNSWFESKCHHTKYVDHYAEFIQQEFEISNKTKALKDTNELLADPDLIIDMKFIAEKATKIVELLTWFESQDVLIHQAYNRVLDLIAWADIVRKAQLHLNIVYLTDLEFL